MKQRHSTCSFSGARAGMRVRQQERRIKCGDRVAIIGRGIALVEHVNDKHVHLILWNRNVLRISRKEIVWDEGNARWETDAETA